MWWDHREEAPVTWALSAGHRWDSRWPLSTPAEGETSLYSQLDEDLPPGSWKAPAKGHRTGSPG